VIPDTAPKAALATPTGLNADLQAGCHNDVCRSQLAPVEDLIRRAFVQDEMLTAEAHARPVPKRTDTELNYVQSRAPRPSQARPSDDQDDQRYTVSEMT
jgi:hypothetical protein